MICRRCNKEIVSLREYYKPHHCRECYNKMMREYGKTRRWLNGTDRTDDLGPDIGVSLRTVGDTIRVFRGRERLA